MILGTEVVSYKTHHYCTHGCGKLRGWFKHSDVRVASNGALRCPICGNRVRIKSRYDFGKHRKEEPIRI